ncbi:MAG: hypothetical protein WC421_01795 [Elusimicrobiales bacterium]
MPEAGNAVLICGDACPSFTTAHTVCAYAAEKLAAAGWRARVVFAGDLLREGNCVRNLKILLEGSSLLMVAFASAGGSLPAPLVKILEAIAAARSAGQDTGLLRLAAIGCFPCGGADAENALDMCRSFAKGTGMEWSGGLAVCGWFTGGKPFAATGAGAARLRKGLDAAMQSLAAGQAIPESAMEQVSQPPDLSSLKSSVKKF